MRAAVDSGDITSLLLPLQRGKQVGRQVSLLLGVAMAFPVCSLT